MGRVRPSCGEGVGRASAVSELTERVTFFFFSITNLELSIISIKLKRFFVIDRAARKIFGRDLRRLGGGGGFFDDHGAVTPGRVGGARVLVSTRPRGVPARVED